MGLCNTLQYEVVSVFRQTLQKPNPTYYIGMGKVQELDEFLKVRSPPLDFALFDCTLKPNQIFNLENNLHARVIDRSTLILMIFLQHAKTNEAKLQVEAAS